jgi:hypothetical protein
LGVEFPVEPLALPADPTLPVEPTLGVEFPVEPLALPAEPTLPVDPTFSDLVGAFVLLLSPELSLLVSELLVEESLEVAVVLAGAPPESLDLPLPLASELAFASELDFVLVLALAPESVLALELLFAPESPLVLAPSFPPSPLPSPPPPPPIC